MTELDKCRHLRGGSWVNDPSFQRATFRYFSLPKPSCHNIDLISFRVVEDAPKERSVFRGGSWYSTPQNVRSDFRNRNDTSVHYGNLSFRIVEDV